MRTPEQNRAHVKAWREKDRDKYLAWKKESNAKNYDPDYFKGYYLRNRDKRRAQVKAWHAANKRRVLNGTLLRLYGVTLDWYEATLEAQGGVCAICHKPPCGRRLMVDHNHATEEARGLLCGPCNASLSRLEKIEGWAESATKYLDKFKK